MDDLTAFVTARLDEDEAIARAVSSFDWSLEDDGARYEWEDLPDAAFTHARRHDPARVLREVAAGRAILARYEDWLARTEDPAYPQAVARDQAREYEDFVLPDLAAIWSDHPDYRPEWGP